MNISKEWEKYHDKVNNRAGKREKNLKFLWLIPVCPELQSWVLCRLGVWTPPDSAECGASLEETLTNILILEHTHTALHHTSLTLFLSIINYHLFIFRNLSVFLSWKSWFMSTLPCYGLTGLLLKWGCTKKSYYSWPKQSNSTQSIKLCQMRDYLIEKAFLSTWPGTWSSQSELLKSAAKKYQRFLEKKSVCG